VILLAEQMNRDEKIGFHKGAIDTLLKERQELLKMASIVTKLTEMHVSALKEMGIDLTQQMQQAQEQAPAEEQPAQPTKKTKKTDDFGSFY